MSMIAFSLMQGHAFFRSSHFTSTEAITLFFRMMSLISKKWVPSSFCTLDFIEGECSTCINPNIDPDITEFVSLISNLCPPTHVSLFYLQPPHSIISSILIPAYHCIHLPHAPFCNTTCNAWLARRRDSVSMARKTPRDATANVNIN